MTKKKVTEKQIETAILTYLSFLPKCFAWKNNTVGIYDTSRGVHRKLGKFSMRGVSDILGIYHGRFLAIEVKRDKSSRVSREQRDFLERVRRLGGIAGICTSVEEAKELLKSSGGGHIKGESDEYNIEGVSE